MARHMSRRRHRLSYEFSLARASLSVAGLIVLFGLLIALRTVL